MSNREGMASISVYVPKEIRDEYKQAIKYLGISRHEHITRYLVKVIGLANKVKRLERYGKEREISKIYKKLLKMEGDE